MKTESELYCFHCANLREVARGIERVEIAARRAIATVDEVTLHALIRLYALLLGAWAECRLKKLLYEPSGFDQADRAKIRAVSDQHGRWRATVEYLFESDSRLPTRRLIPTRFRSPLRRATPNVSNCCKINYVL
jgi:hypothetical protein